MYSVQLETVLLILYTHFPFQAVGVLQLPQKLNHHLVKANARVALLHYFGEG